MSLTDPSNEPKASGRSPLQALLPYTTVAMVIVALYVAWTLYSRHADTARAEQAAVAKKQDAEQRVNAQIFGSGEVKFTTFEASDASVHPGQTTQLCYGVVNAKSVQIDPPIEPIKPSERHCMDIAPKKTTTYKITADDGAGHSKSLSLTIHVH